MRDKGSILWLDPDQLIEDPENVRHDTPDLDKACFKRANGETLTGTQRLELLAKHWREHVHELQAAEAKR